MLINTQSNVIQSLQGQYAAYFFAGEEQVYSKRAQLRDAVAACTLTLAKNVSQLASKQTARLKPAYGQMTHIDGISQIVVPKSVVFPQYDSGTSQVLSEQCLLPLQQANLSDYWHGSACSGLTAQGEIIFTFASPVNLSAIQQVASSYLVGDVKVQVGGNWQSISNSFTSSAHTVSVGVNNVTAVKITVPATYAVGGSFIFFGTEVTASTTANVSPLLHAVKLIMASGAIYSPMLIASYASTAGEVGIRYQQGSFNNTWVKNKLTEAITVRMKIFDGA